MKVAVLMPIWKRPEILSAILKRWKSPSQKMNIKLYFVFIVSKEDPHFAQLVDICKYFLKSDKIEGIVVEFPNLPVASKQNAGLDIALKKEWDYLMNLGSDNVLADDYWNLVWPEMWSGTDVILSNRVVFLDSHTGEVIEWRYSLIGAGRLIARRLIDAAWKKFGYLYTPHMNSGMDTCSRLNYTKAFGSHSETVLNQSLVVDIKSFTNINLFMDIKNRGHEVTKVDAEGFERFANLSGLCDEIAELRRVFRGVSK